MNIISIAPANISLPSRIAHALAQRMQAWTDAIDAVPPSYRHRMGAWEIGASPSLQAALHAMRAQAAQHGAAPSTSATHELTK